MQGTSSTNRRGEEHEISAVPNAPQELESFSKQESFPRLSCSWILSSRVFGVRQQRNLSTRCSSFPYICVDRSPWSAELREGIWIAGVKIGGLRSLALYAP